MTKAQRRVLETLSMAPRGTITDKSAARLQSDTPYDEWRECFALGWVAAPYVMTVLTLTTAGRAALQERA